MFNTDVLNIVEIAWEFLFLCIKKGKQTPRDVSQVVPCVTI